MDNQQRNSFFNKSECVQRLFRKEVHLKLIIILFGNGWISFNILVIFVNINLHYSL